MTTFVESSVDLDNTLNPKSYTRGQTDVISSHTIPSSISYMGCADPIKASVPILIQGAKEFYEDPSVVDYPSTSGVMSASSTISPFKIDTFAFVQNDNDGQSRVS